MFCCSTIQTHDGHECNPSTQEYNHQACQASTPKAAKAEFYWRAPWRPLAQPCTSDAVARLKRRHSAATRSAQAMPG